MYEHWIEDQVEQNEKYKQYAIFLGSFSNPEAAQQMLDSGKKFTSEDSDFQESIKMVEESMNREKEQKRHRRRQVIG